MPSPAPELHPGFADPVAASQQVFRSLLDAMARPGRLYTLPVTAADVGPLSAAAAAVCLTLCDADTAVWVDAEIASSRPACDYLRFHCGSPLVEAPAQAAFAVISRPRAMPGLEAFSDGEAEHPERATTLILQVEKLAEDGGVRLTGPGIEREHRLRVDGLPAGLWRDMRRNHAAFPLGVDLFCVAGARVVGLPRTVLAEE